MHTHPTPSMATWDLEREGNVGNEIGGSLSPRRLSGSDSGSRPAPSSARGDPGFPRLHASRCDVRTTRAVSSKALECSRHVMTMSSRALECRRPIVLRDYRAVRNSGSPSPPPQMSFKTLPLWVAHPTFSPATLFWHPPRYGTPLPEPPPPTVGRPPGGCPPP